MAWFSALQNGSLRNGICGTIMCHIRPSILRGGCKAPHSFFQILLTSRPLVLGARIPGDSTYSRGKRAASRRAM